MSEDRVVNSCVFSEGKLGMKNILMMCGSMSAV